MQGITNRKKESSQTMKTGMPPGKLVYIGKDTESPVRITVIDYDAAKSGIEGLLKRMIPEVKEVVAESA